MRPLRLQGCEASHPNCGAAKAAGVIGAVVISIDGGTVSDAFAAQAAFAHTSRATVTVVFKAVDGTDRQVSVLFVAH